MHNSKVPYLAQRPNFMRVVGRGIGALNTISLLWQFASYGGMGWWLFLIAIAALSAWISAYFMWFVFSAIYLQGTTE